MCHVITRIVIKFKALIFGFPILWDFYVPRKQHSAAQIKPFILSYNFV